MNDPNQPNLNQQNPADAGNAGSQVPPPPAPGEKSVEVRTMNSDISSMKQNGGLAPEPKQFNLGSIDVKPEESSASNNGNLSQEPSAPSPYQAPSAPSPMPEQNPANQAGGNNPPAAPASLGQNVNFSSPPASVENSEEPVFTPGQIQPEEPSSNGGIDWKKIMLAIGGIVIFSLVGYFGYVFVSGMLSSSPVELEETPAIIEDEADEADAEEDFDTGLPDIITHSPYASFSGENAIGVIGSITVNPDSDINSFRGSLSNIMQAIEGGGVVGEVIMETSDGSQSSFADLLSIILPELESENISDYFAHDFTSFFFFNGSNSAWPGYIAKLSPGANIFEAQSIILGIEDSPNIANFFIVNPGEQRDEDWRRGEVNSIPTRFVTFTNEPAAINYVWLNDYLIISTSYQGLQAIVPKLVF